MSLLFLLHALVASAPANIELACFELATQQPPCDDVAAKLRVYHQGHTVAVVAPDAAETADNTIYRVTVRGGTETCALEIITLAELDAPPRLTTFDCGSASDRQIALHIKSELASDFDGALATLLAQPKRVRVVRSQLVGPPPASAPVVAPLPPEPTPLVVAPEVAPPASAPIAPPAWQVTLAAAGALSLYGAVPFGSASVAVGAQSPWPMGGEVGVRGSFRPDLRVARGPIGLTLVAPYLRAHWRFAFFEHVHLDAGIEAQLLVGLAQVERGFEHVFVTAALGPTARLGFPFLSGRLTPFLDLGVAGVFNRVELRSRGGPQLALVPVFVNLGAGLQVSF